MIAHWFGLAFVLTTLGPVPQAPEGPAKPAKGEDNGKPGSSALAERFAAIGKDFEDLETKFHEKLKAAGRDQEKLTSARAVAA